MKDGGFWDNANSIRGVKKYITLHKIYHLNITHKATYKINNEGIHAVFQDSHTNAIIPTQTIATAHYTCIVSQNKHILMSVSELVYPLLPSI